MLKFLTKFHQNWRCYRVPLYYEAKVLFILYLWHPKTQGALYLYTAYVQPFLSDHEALVDEYVQEAKTRVSDFAAAHFQRYTEHIPAHLFLPCSVVAAWDFANSRKIFLLRFTQFLQSKAHLAISALQHAQQAKVNHSWSL